MSDVSSAAPTSILLLTSIKMDGKQTTSVKAPPGWTTEIWAIDKVEYMLETMTSLKGIHVDLYETSHNRYVFHSGDDYYFWNSVTEECDKVLSPKKYDQLVDQMRKDIRGVKVMRMSFDEEE